VVILFVKIAAIKSIETNQDRRLLENLALFAEPKKLKIGKQDQNVRNAICPL
jgi:hypothetical protein